MTRYERFKLKKRIKSDQRPDNFIPDLEGEIWVDAIYNEGVYKVSNMGRIKSIDRKETDKKGIIIRKLSYLLNPFKNNEGYYRVDMEPFVLVSNIVFYSFYPETIPEKGFVIDHIDEDKSNNKLSNLQKITHAENVQKNYFLSRNKTSKYKGVHFNQERQKWVAQTRENGTTRALGRFNSEEEARKAVMDYNRYV